MRRDGRQARFSLSKPGLFFVLAAVLLLVGISFGLGVGYGEHRAQIGRLAGLKNNEENAKVAEIEAYLKEKKSAFHFQKALESGNPETKRYLYTLESAPTSFSDLGRQAPSGALPHEETAPKIESELVTVASLAEVEDSTSPVAEEGPDAPSESTPKTEGPAIAQEAGGSAPPVPAPSASLEPPSPTIGDYAIQAEVFQDEKSANRRKNFFIGKGLPVFVEVRQGGGSLPYRLMVGPYREKAEAVATLEKVREIGRDDVFVVRLAKQTGK